MSLPALVLAYAAASFAHHAHNAAFLDEYPNMPAWLSGGHVYAAWLAITAVGALRFLLYRRRSETLGLIVLALYAALGFYGLAHYAAAPWDAHSLGMHATIWAEVLTAAALLGTIAGFLARR